MYPEKQNIHGVLHGVDPSLDISTPPPPFPPDKKHDVSPLLHFFWNGIPYSYLLISFIKPFKTSDFSKHLSRYDMKVLHLKIFSNIL